MLIFAGRINTMLQISRLLWQTVTALFSCVWTHFQLLNLGLSTRTTFRKNNYQRKRLERYDTQWRILLSIASLGWLNWVIWSNAVFSCKSIPSIKIKLTCRFYEYLTYYDNPKEWNGLYLQMLKPETRMGRSRSNDKLRFLASYPNRLICQEVAMHA